MSHSPKLLMVGWDAADWEIIKPLMDKGALPTLKKLMDAGSFGALATLDPPISPIVWTSIATGKRAYDHGITGFTEKGPQGKVRASRGSSRKVKAFWNILEERGLKSHVVGWWPSHPAEKSNGIHVSNFYGMAPPEEGGWPLFPGSVYPEKYSDELAELRVHPKEMTSAIVSPFFPNANLESDSDPIVRSVMRILSHAATVQAAATWAMEKEPWDVMAVYFDALDHFKHLAMKYHPPQMEGIPDEDFKNYHFIVEGAYRFHDMMLDRLITLAGKDCAVLVLSDHGFYGGNQRRLQLPSEPGAPALEHSPYGIVTYCNPHNKTPKQVFGASVLDIAPTVLRHFGLACAEDMEGRVIEGLFESELPRISTYENGQSTERLTEGSIADTELLKTLEDLGYIDLTDIERNNDQLPENDFYLARSLWEGGRLEEAESILSRLSKDYPSEDRYLKYWASLALQMGLHQTFDRALGLLSERNEDQTVLYFKGLKALNESKWTAAKEYFSRLETSGSAHLLERMGQCYLALESFDVALDYFDKSLHIHAKGERALLGKAQCLLGMKRYEESVDAILFLLDIRFYTPQAHYELFRALKALGQWENATQALAVAVTMNPKNALWRAQWEELSGQKSPSQQEGESNPTLVVSGPPRSGTSLLMQMLVAGGIEAFDDGNRPPDQHNPKGYYEHDGVKNLAGQNEFLMASSGKAVKVVFPLIRFIPPTQQYKVIVVQRPLEQVVASQQTMKGEEAFDLMAVAKWESEWERSMGWLSRQDHCSVLVVNYSEILAHPEEAATQISKFVDRPFNILKAAAVVDKNLNHHSPKN
ncbi:MAG: hypothetical protein SchgKO_19760 [Schleiferiaceae bacterium]